MKKMIQVLCSIFFATTLSLPAEALANPVEELDDDLESCTAQYAESDSYHLALVTGDFGLQLASIDTAHRSDPPMLFISDPAGKMITNAQVITTIIEPNGTQVMNRAWPFRSGYLLSTSHLSPGRHLVEAEIITNGWLLTDAFSFVKS
ncbi:MAG: hypothetical protein QNK24_05560 [Desulfuromusa sp.]|nr:hypothetical protein [Desulfuromusa sp.]